MIENNSTITRKILKKQPTKNKRQTNNRYFKSRKPSHKQPKTTVGMSHPDAVDTDSPFGRFIGPRSSHCCLELGTIFCSSWEAGNRKKRLKIENGIKVSWVIWVSRLTEKVEIFDNLWNQPEKGEIEIHSVQFERRRRDAVSRPPQTEKAGLPRVSVVSQNLGGSTPALRPVGLRMNLLEQRYTNTLQHTATNTRDLYSNLTAWGIDYQWTVFCFHM